MMEKITQFIRRLSAVDTFYRCGFKPISSRARKAKAIVALGGAAIAVFYAFPLIWHTSYIRNFDLTYPKQVVVSVKTKSADQQVEVGGDAKTPRTLGRSMLVDMMIYLIDFSVNQNKWVPSMPQYKMGLFGIPFENTPFFDNKAAFQRGTLIALRRTAVELNDTLGRVRGTSAVDPAIQSARGNLQTNDDVWWINPFSDSNPFGPLQPTQNLFRLSEEKYKLFNNKLVSGEAVFDTRADNLKTYLDHIAKDMGSTIDQLSKRATSKKYDPKADRYVDGEGNNRGWFDFEADNMYYEALGQMYAYHGLLQAAREDFKYVIETKKLNDLWDRLEAHVAEAAALDPLIVSNGARDGFVMPGHLIAMSEMMLRARANLEEISDVLGR